MLKDLGGRKEVLQERLNSNKELLQQNDNYCRQRLKQASKKITRRLVLDNRLKLRKLGAGAPVLLDSEDEEFIAKALESKSTVHGRLLILPEILITWLSLMTFYLLLTTL